MLNRLINKLRRPNHTWKRFGNACLNFISKIFKIPYVLGLPELIIIEPTDMCNLKCPLCPAGTGKSRRARGAMSFENFKKIIDEVGDRIYYLTLNNCGEPFLNRDIFKMISYASKKGVIVNMATNAQLIDRQCAAGIIGAGLDGILISMDGVTQETYEKYKVGGSLRKVIDAIRFMREARDVEGVKKPSIEIQFIITKHNEGEIEEIKKMAADMGVDRLVFKKLCDLHGLPPDLGRMEDLLPVNPDYRAYKVESGAVKWNVDKEDKNFCATAWNYPAVNWDGSLYPCCFDYESFDLGNVFESGFRKLWNGEKFIALRRQIREQKGSLPVCSKCPVNFYDDLTWDIPLKTRS